MLIANKTAPRGYSLLELLVGLSILGLAAAVTMFSAREVIKHLALTTEARGLEANLRQIHLMAKEYEQEITMKLSPQAYRAYFTAKPSALLFNRSLSHQLTLQAGTPEQNEIIFYSFKSD